jgi:hypothetical protein
MRYFILVFLLMAGWNSIQAQSADTTVKVHKDPRLDALSKRQKAVNIANENSTVNGHLKGWRIQVLSTNNRELANKTMTDLLMKFPMHKAYLIYQVPFFKVRVGNFKDRADGEVLKKQLRKMFPSGVYIIPDIIEYKITEEDLEEMEN